MNEQKKRPLGSGSYFDYEKTVLRYIVALEKGDLDTVTAILQMAEQDDELEQMLLDINDIEATEIDGATHAQDAAIVRELVQTYLLSTIPEVPPELPPLTVGSVIARIHADAAALRVHVEPGALTATHSHQMIDTLLPVDLSLRSVRQLLEQLGVKAGRRFQDLFRETALFMRMGRNQGMARLAATRRQQQSRHQATTQPTLKPPGNVPTESELSNEEPK